MLVYLPVGLVLGIYAMRGRCGRWAGVFLAVAIGAMLSLLVETLQTVLVSRVASCTDILLNGVGAAIGACLGVGLSGSAGAAMAQVRNELADLPFTTAASLLTLGLFLYNLAPFDFVMTSDALHASFGRAHLGLMDARVLTVGTPPFAAMAHQFTGAGWFAVLGYLLALGGRERGCPSTMSLGWALKDGLILVALVEFMQLFTRSHTFDAAAMLIRSFSVTFGAWCAVFMIDSLTGSAWRRKPGLAVPTGILAILAVFQVSLLIAPCANPQGGTFSAERTLAVDWLPLQTLRRLPCHKAIAEVLSVLMTFGALALTVGCFLRRLRVAHARWWTFGALTVLAVVCEGLRCACLAKRFDCTTVLLALLAAGLIRHVYDTVRSAAGVTGRQFRTGKRIP